MFEARWPKGTCEHTAFALLLCTGQRRSDVVRMAWDDVDNGSIRVVQGKTGAKPSRALQTLTETEFSPYPPPPPRPSPEQALTLPLEGGGPGWG